MEGWAPPPPSISFKEAITLAVTALDKEEFNSNAARVLGEAKITQRKKANGDIIFVVQTDGWRHPN